MTSIIQPPVLKPGDTIGIAAPASSFNRNAFLHGISHLREAGYRPFFLPGIFDVDHHLAGPDRRRTEELHFLFSEPRIKAIFCARGGWGAMRLMRHLDPDLFLNNPKIFMGYSDLTALHVFLNAVCGIPSFHGPLVTEMGEISPEALAQQLKRLSEKESWGEIPVEGMETWGPGEAEGSLTGGNLTVLTHLLGTPVEPIMDDAILFLEDRGEKIYAIDRLLTHLENAGIFDTIRGLILGRFVPPKNADHDPAHYHEEVKRLILEKAGPPGIPVVANFPAGHGGENVLFPLGVTVHLDASRGRLTITESCLR